MGHLNICSLRNKVDEVFNILSGYNLHVLALTETHLNPDINSDVLKIEGYNIFRLDRGRKGGGVAIYCQDHIPVKIRTDLGYEGVEFLWLQVQLPHLRPMLIGCCYRPPNATAVYLDNICKIMDKVCDSNSEVFVLGDFNIDWNMNDCPMKARLHTLADACNLSQVVKKPTRIFRRADGIKSSTCIDLIFTNVAELCSKAISLPMGCSDHNLIAVGRKTKIPKRGQKIVLKRSFKHFNENNFCDEVRQVDWSQVLQEDDPNLALGVFDHLLFPIVNKYAPVKKLTVRNVRSPWIDQDLKVHMMERDRAKAEAIKSGGEQEWNKYRKLRNFVTMLNKKKKRMYYHKKISSIRTDSKATWNILNQLMGKSGRSTPSYLEVEGQFMTKPEDIANYLSYFFSDKIQKLKNGMEVCNSGQELSSSLIMNKIMKNKSCTFHFDEVQISTVEQHIRTSKNKQAGIDNLDARLLKPVANALAPPICHIINLSFEKSICPADWKIAKIIPLPKNNRDTFSGKNSRPISILPLLSKIMERIAYEQIQHYFCTNDLITPHQHAYRKGHSTATALTDMTDEWLRKMDSGKIIGSVLLDFSAAFDILDHMLLVNKLHCYGFDRRSVAWISSYLTNRKYCVYFNGSFSVMREMNCGVPQGSCLGPLLFSIFTNDLPLMLKQTSIGMYADDSTLYVAASTANELENILNDDLLRVKKWVDSNKLVLNIEKTKCIVLCSKWGGRLDPKLNVKIDDKEIEQVTEVKLLGVLIDSRMTWTSHINEMVKKMGRGMAAIKYCRKYLPGYLVKQLMQAIVLSQMDYCSVVWSNTSENNLNKLQVVLNKAARIVLNCSYRTRVSEMLNTLNWLSVKDRLYYTLLCFVRSVIMKKCPATLFNFFVFSSSTHTYSTRHSVEERFLLPAYKTGAGQRTLHYRGMLAWNSLPNFLIKENIDKSFKTKLKLFLFIQNT